MPYFLSRKWFINRRHMLRGIGASVALPLLDCMTRPGSNTDSAIPSDLPRRSVFIYVPNGVNTLSWQITSAGKGYELTKPLESLKPFRDSMTPISGLHHTSAIGKGHFCDQVWLTGASIPGDPVNFQNTVSADQLMASSVGRETRIPSLELSVTGGSLAWNKSGVSLPAERVPSKIFQRLFVSQRSSRISASDRLKKRKSVLDLIREDAKRFQGSVGANDKSKLDEYLQSVREVERRTKRAEAWLDKPLPKVEPDTVANLNREIAESRAGDYYRTMYDLMVLALRTDMTRVITCMSGSESRALALPEIGVNQSRHELSHHNGDPIQLSLLTQCDTFLVEQFAYFLTKLASYQESGDTLLDRTMVLFGSGMSYGHSHGNANLPIILAGGNSFGIEHGRHLDFNLPKIGNYQLDTPSKHYQLCLKPIDSSAQMSKLLLTMIQRMGIQQVSFSNVSTPLF